MLALISRPSRYLLSTLFCCLVFSTIVAVTANETSGVLQRQLLDAASREDAAAVRRLLAQGVNIESRDARGRTALLVATHHNAINVARILIEAGADVNAMDNMSDSPYLYAGAEGRLEILRMTLDHGADLASVNRYGGTALTPAAHHGHVETVDELLKTKIDIDQVNSLGWTALLEAVILGDGGPTYIEIVRLLIEADANVNLADKDGETPLAHAVSKRYEGIAEMLRSAGAK